MACSCTDSLPSFPPLNILHILTLIFQEVLEDGLFTTKSDVYALGIIMWEVLAREYPFSSFNFKMGFHVELAVKSGKRPEIPSSHLGTSEFIALMQRCWDQVAAKRPSMAEVVKELSICLSNLPSASPSDYSPIQPQPSLSSNYTKISSQHYPPRSSTILATHHRVRSSTPPKDSLPSLESP